MIVLVSVLRSRASGWAAEDESLVPVLNSLSRPVSGGFLLAALSFPWIFTDRPAIVAGLLSLVVIPPLIRFLSPLVSVCRCDARSTRWRPGWWWTWCATIWCPNRWSIGFCCWLKTWLCWWR